MARAMVSDRINTIFPDMAREGAIRLRPQTPKWNELIALMNKEMEGVYSGASSAAEATKRLTSLIEALLRKRLRFPLVSTGLSGSTGPLRG
jgi:hypothetical protein